MPGVRAIVTVCLILAFSFDRSARGEMVGHWTFDEGKGQTVRDSSGKGNHGRICGARWVEGLSGSGLEFTGDANCYVEVPHSNSLSPTAALTVTAWAKVYRWPTYHSCLVYKISSPQLAPDYTHRSYTLWLTRGGITFTSTLDMPRTHVYCYSPGGHTYSTGNLYPPNRFTHFAMVIDCARKTMTGYVNGIQVGQVPYPGSRIHGGKGPLRLGGHWETHPHIAGLIGVLDEVRIYNHALTAEEIARDMASGRLEVVAFEDFNEALGSEWDILNPDRSHYSLEKKHGTLTITTQAGEFTGARADSRNLFLADLPKEASEDYRITTRVSEFKSTGGRQRAALVCWTDQDNFLEWIYEYHRGRNAFAVVQETEGESQEIQDQLEQGLETVWLRVTKAGKRYTFSKSLDGKVFDNVRSIEWTGPELKWIGLAALGGPGPDAPEVDISFDQIEVAAFGAGAPPMTPEPPKPAGRPVAQPVQPAAGACKYTIRPEALRIPQNLQRCANNMHSLYRALKKYQEVKGEFPTHLSDLVPEYLATGTLVCLDNPVARSEMATDPKLPCSYGYQYSDAPQPYDQNETYRDFKDKERKTFGDLVPLVRCYHPNDQVLNLSFDGRVYLSGLMTWQRMLVRRQE